jgi:cellobiose phosphorylase
VLATVLQGDGDRALELWNLINPIYHATTPAEVQCYKVEPYVVCADIYGARPHTGRGGWTWYTGSASWLYRVALEAILGFQLQGSALRFAPCIPKAWPGYELTYRHGTATYRIRVDNALGMGRGVRSIYCDGKVAAGNVVTLSDDGRTHLVQVELGSG